MAYRGYGTRKKIFLQGHVLDDLVMYESEKKDKWRKNFRAMLSRFMSEALPNVRVEVLFKDVSQIVRTDENGLFRATFEFDEPLKESGWLPVKFRVADDFEDMEIELLQEKEVYVHDDSSAFGIISDIDDTILISHASQTFRKLRLVLTKNAHTRMPFDGVAEFYAALHRGCNQSCFNPIFYVSSSEWNLYDFLEDFCALNGIPKGPFLLQEYKQGLVDLISSGGGSHEHKLQKAKHLLAVFPNLKFILIGDSGQHDALLYGQLAEEFPDRVLGIYIRDVSGRRKDENVRTLSRKLKTKGVEMLLVENSAAAARHALKAGFISGPSFQLISST